MENSLLTPGDSATPIESGSAAPPTPETIVESAVPRTDALAMVRPYCDAAGRLGHYRLLELVGRALEQSPSLDEIRPWVSDSGEGRWTVAEAIDLDVAAPVITLALLQRLRSRDAESFTDRLLAALRNEFGGHAVKKA